MRWGANQRRAVKWYNNTIWQLFCGETVAASSISLAVPLQCFVQTLGEDIVNELVDGLAESVEFVDEIAGERCQLAAVCAPAPDLRIDEPPFLCFLILIVAA